MVLMILVIALFFKQRHDFFKKVMDGSSEYSSSKFCWFLRLPCLQPR
ncbi:unnamed protein product [Brassica oleracea]